MRRILALLAVTLAFLPVLLAPAPAHADVNDFEFESFHSDYTLGRDDEGRSRLVTTEHIVALFPGFDQNRGIIRDIPRVYDGHETEVSVRSVTDEHGTPRPFDAKTFGDYLRLTIAVPPGEFVHGAQHYIIEYAQRDVTRFFDDTGADEFYWDVNGTEWAQPFGTVSATVTLADGLGDALDGNLGCYRGGFGSTERCSIGLDEDQRITLSESRLDAGENVSFAIGFQADTFAAAPAPPPAPEPPTPWLAKVPLLLWGSLAAFAATAAAFVGSLVRGRGATTGRAVIAQYEPPEGLSTAVAAQLLRVPKKAMTATLLDFAVRRKIRLLHDAATDVYGVQALTDAGLTPNEKRAYARIFTGLASAEVDPGTAYWFASSDTQLGDSAAILRSEAAAEVKRAGLLKKPDGRAIAAVVLLPIVGLALMVGHALVTGQELLFILSLAVGINVLVWVVLGMSLLLAKLRRPTMAGALLLDHLKGLREYIRLAEADRIRMLQSASGAEVSAERVVQVYERLLPYAVLFGFEREWQGELARYYRESTPEWVHGQGDFAHVLAISSFSSRVAHAPTTVAQSSMSGSGSGGSFSSFSGGSSGGGFSGGGGGGGGGGGI